MKKKDPTSHRIIEKRRRDRMNNCLADLSKLIPAHYMKKGRGRVEKTEIIEMAIKHLKDLIEANNAQQSNLNPNLHHHHHHPHHHHPPGGPQNPPSQLVQSINESYHIKTILNSGPRITDDLVATPTAATSSEIIVPQDTSIKQFSSHSLVETNGYIITPSNQNHHHHPRKNHHQQEIYHNNNLIGSDKTHRSSPTPSSSGSDSSSSSGSSSSSSICGGKTGDGCGCGMLGETGAGRTSGSSSDGGSSSSSSSSCSGSGGSNISRSTSAWYKKRWLVRSFSRSNQR